MAQSWSLIDIGCNPQWVTLWFRSCLSTVHRTTVFWIRLGILFLRILKSTGRNWVVVFVWELMKMKTRATKKQWRWLLIARTLAHCHVFTTAIRWYWLSIYIDIMWQSFWGTSWRTVYERTVRYCQTLRIIPVIVLVVRLFTTRRDAWSDLRFEVTRFRLRSEEACLTKK